MMPKPIITRKRKWEMYEQRALLVYHRSSAQNMWKSGKLRKILQQKGN